MEDDLASYLKIKRLREERKKDVSKENLLAMAKKRIRTTMIGALSSIEDNFAFLIADDKEIQEIFQKLRSEILDRGNNQIRNIESDFSNYEIIWKKYTYKLPFKGKGN